MKGIAAGMNEGEYKNEDKFDESYTKRCDVTM